MKLSQLHETGMSRRNFLKFLGKAGAVAAGAPLDKLASLANPNKLIGSISSSPIRIITAMSGTHYGRGLPPSLSWCVDLVGGAYYNIAELVDRDKIKSFGDEDWGFGAEVSEDFLNKIAAKHGVTIDDDFFWHDRFGIEIGAKDDHIPLGPVIIDPIKQWVKEYAGWDIPSLIQSPNDVWELEQHGLKKLVPEEVRGELDDAIENVRDKIGHEHKEKELEQRRKKDPYSGRETGHEKQNQFDPESSRPAQALGQFESKLTAPQLKTINEADIEKRSLERQGASNPGDQEAGVRHLLSLLRAGEINRKDLSTAAAFDNKIAETACKAIGEQIPDIKHPIDIISMFVTTKDELDIAISTMIKIMPPSNGLDHGPREEASRVLGWIRNSDTSLGRLKEMSYQSFEQIAVSVVRSNEPESDESRTDVAQVPFARFARRTNNAKDWLLQTLKPMFVHPRLQ